MLRRRLSTHAAARQVVCDEAQSLVPLQEPLEDQDFGLTIGRTSANALILDHPELPLLISRKHATIALRDGQVTVTDHGATNGTWVNERRLPSLSSVALQAGDLVSFGGPGCIMREGAPIRNPFMYEYLPEAPEDLLESPEMDIIIVNGGEEQISSVSARARSRLAHMVTRDMLEDEDGGVNMQWRAQEPVRMLGIPEGRENERPRAALERVLFHDPAEDANSDQGHITGVNSPRVRDRDGPLASNDANPSPSKKSKTKQSVERPALCMTRNENSPAKVTDPKSMQTLEDQLTCGICQDLIVAPHSVVPCGHMYCGECLHDLLRHSRTGLSCPHCRTDITSAPVKCRAVDNILGEVVERLLKQDALVERAARRARWEAVSEQARRAWMNYFDPGFRVTEIGRMGDANPAAENSQLNTMLENLRQVRETLRSVANPSELDDASQGQEQRILRVGRGRAVAHVVEYARSSRTRCACCRQTIHEGALRVGMQAQHAHSTGVPYLATRWFHFACFSQRDWADVDRGTLHGVRALEAADQRDVEAALVASGM